MKKENIGIKKRPEQDMGKAKWLEKFTELDSGRIKTELQWTQRQNS